MENHLLLFCLHTLVVSCRILCVLQLFIFYDQLIFFFLHCWRGIKKLVNIFAIFVDQDNTGSGISYSDWEGPQTNRWAEHIAKRFLIRQTSSYFKSKWSSVIFRQ